MNKISLFVFTTLLLIPLLSCKEEISEKIDIAPSTIEQVYAKNDGPDKNPMKGWNSGGWRDDDWATVGFQYIKWKDFESIDDEFNFEAVEEIIERPGTKNKHVIFRLYADSSGLQPTSDAGPTWLFADMGIARLEAPNGRYITDYNDPKYIEEAVEAIKALAEHYDNDPRILSFQLGILGYFGEWTTFGFDGTFSITAQTQNQIIDAYKQNFFTAKLMGSQPWNTVLNETGGIGFHNDYFGPNDDSDKFNDAVKTDSKWLDGPIGGEMPAELSNSQFEAMLTSGSVMEMLTEGHYTSMMGRDLSCNTSAESPICDGFMKTHKKMGYNFQIERAIFSESLSQNDDLKVNILLSNIGVAPIYHDWDIQFALLDARRAEIATFDVSYVLTSLAPDARLNINLSNSLKDVAAGTYKLGVRIIQPGANKAKADRWKLDVRNTYILFSNDMEEIKGVWGDNHAILGGWSILGEIELKPNIVPLPDLEL
jgi:hypothetical protein